MGRHSAVVETVSRNPRRVALVVSVASALALIGTTAATPAGNHIASLGEAPSVSALRPGTRVTDRPGNRGVTLQPISAAIPLDEDDDTDTVIEPIVEPITETVPDVTEPTPEPELPVIDVPEPAPTEEPEPPVTEDPEPTKDPEPRPPAPGPIIDVPLPGCS